MKKGNIKNLKGEVGVHDNNKFHNWPKKELKFQCRTFICNKIDAEKNEIIVGNKVHLGKKDFTKKYKSIDW